MTGPASGSVSAGPKRSAGDQRPEPIAPPPEHNPPARGTLVRLSSFEFRRVQYRLSGYLSPARGSRRNDSVCVQIKRTPPVAPGLDRQSVMCAGHDLLRRGLRRERVPNVGAGGGPPKRLEVTGFTVVGVSRVQAVGTDWPWHAEVTVSAREPALV